MKRFKQLALLLLGLAFLTPASAQRLLVEYDFLNDDFSYYKVSKSGVKKRISSAVVTRKHNVKVQVVNYNPFVYTAVANYSTKTIDDAPNLNFLSLIRPLGLPTGGTSFLNSITGSNPVTRGGLWADPKASASMQKVQETYEALYQAEQMSNSIDFVLEKVHKLKYNPYLPADSIKSFCNTLVTDLMGQPAIQPQDFLTKANQINSAVNNDVAQLNAHVASFQSAYTQYANTRGKSGGFEGEGSDVMVQNWGKQAMAFANSFNSELLLKKLDYLETEYQAIMNTPFVFNTSDVAEGDEITVTIDFYRNPENDGQYVPGDLADLSDLTKIKSKELDITVKGDLKINSSLGMAFPYFNDNNVFINKDSSITAVEGNNFTPNIAAYLNFYPYSGRNATIGGTFGVGVPISSDSKNFNFLMGASTIFGSNNRLVLNFGATLGQVNALDQGYEVGDKLQDALVDVPTRNAYQWGGFIGISFSLVDLTQ